jgi:uncharacterized repeat protein (TIGR03837 family)
MRIDVFCRVVDNYGDAGFTWRLARLLTCEHDATVTLWIDALPALARLLPSLDTTRDDQTYAGVRVRRLRDHAAFDLADAVVEGFGCGLPDDYLRAMASARKPPVWVNLEYLSAEPWIESVHGLPSRHPRLPLTRHFFFPGFTRATGGLLRERDLFARRDRAVASEETPAFLRHLAGTLSDPATTVVSLFCYANPRLPALLDAWSESDTRIACLVPEGVATASFDAWLAGAVPHAGQTFVRGALTLATLPFLAQDDYDFLLWLCDVNFVRGEDSFVRAQWAARPFAWHIYPQADDAHRVKLDAFLDRYLADAPAGDAAAIRDFWRAWNGGDDDDSAARAWPAFHDRCAAAASHTARWSERLAQLPDLAGALEEFCKNRL